MDALYFFFFVLFKKKRYIRNGHFFVFVANNDGIAKFRYHSISFISKHVCNTYYYFVLSEILTITNNIFVHRWVVFAQ